MKPKTIQAAINAMSEWTGWRAIPALTCWGPSEAGRNVILDVPSYSQTDDYSCGATAAWSIFETFRPRANFKKFYQAVNPIPGEGVGPRGIVSALRKFKIGTHYRRRMKWKDIKQTIDDGFPMLVGTGYEIPELQGDHWNFIYGYGEHPNRVFLGNQMGVIRNQEAVPYREFYYEWWNPRGDAIVCWGT